MRGVGVHPTCVQGVWGSGQWGGATRTFLSTQGKGDSLLASTGKVDHWTLHELALRVHFHNLTLVIRLWRGGIIGHPNWLGKMSAPCSVVPCCERYVRVVWFVALMFSLQLFSPLDSHTHEHNQTFVALTSGIENHTSLGDGVFSEVRVCVHH